MSLHCVFELILRQLIIMMINILMVICYLMMMMMMMMIMLMMIIMTMNILICYLTARNPIKPSDFTNLSISLKDDAKV